MIRFRTIEQSDPQFETAALRYLTVKSPSLKGRVDVSVFIPKQAIDQENIPVIVLLHGVYGSHWAWTMKGGAHLTLEKLIAQGEVTPFILVMPSDGLWGDGIGYVPHAYQNVEAWIGNELPQLIRQTIGEVSELSKFYISGLSMGGYGAFRVGVKYASIYHGISSHSSITDIHQMEKFVEEDWTFWDKLNEEGAIAKLMSECASNLPPIRFDCGSDDLLFQANQLLHQDLIEAGIIHEYEELEGGHNWMYWQKNVKRTFRFFHHIHQGVK